MSDKTPHWPGADGKPGVNFGPKSLPETEGGKPTPKGAGKGGSSNPRLDAAAKNQPGQALAVPGKNNKQVKQTGGKPQQGGKQPAVGAKAAPQALPGPVGDKKPGTANPKQPNKPNQRTARPMPQQVRAALPGTQPGKPAGAQQAAGATAGAAAPGAAAPGAAAAGAAAAGATTKVAGDTAKAAPWAATPTVGKSDKTAKDKSHKPEGTLSKVGEVRRTRKARLRISRIDPWSVMKTTFLFSIAFGIMLVVIVAVLWAVVAGSGALQSINSTMTQLIGDSGSQFNVEDYINAGRVIGFAAVLAALDVVIITAVSTLFAFLYNLAAAVIGGLEVTLAED